MCATKKATKRPTKKATRKTKGQHGGPRANSGGARPGAGRKKSANPRGRSPMLSVRVPVELHAAVQLEAEALGVSLPDAVRIALAAWVGREKKSTDLLIIG